MKYPTETIEGWISAVNDEATKPLNKFEEDFMINITDQFDRTGFLSEGQIKTLEGIYANKTS